MELTQAQISEIVYEKASTEQGLHELITLLLNSLLKHERTLCQNSPKKHGVLWRKALLGGKGLPFGAKCC